MAPRAIGALFALAAAIAFVVSVASQAWWSGYPDYEGHTITAKTADIGLIGGTGCNIGGSCETIELDDTFAMIGYGELGAIGLAVLFSLLVMRAALRIS